MSWEYRLASEFKKRNNKEVNPWITADVISPVWDEDKEKYVGELIISAYGGEVMLKSNMLEGNTTGLHENMTVQLVGNVFSKSAGSQKMLVVGRSGVSTYSDNSDLQEQIDLLTDRVLALENALLNKEEIE